MRSPPASSRISDFEAAYVTGAGIANSFLGIPDNGQVTMTELVDHVAAIRDVFPGPLVVDADTGFGNALDMMRTVRALERAGADAIQIEDQLFPKRCGHFAGKEVIPAAEMIARSRRRWTRAGRTTSSSSRAPMRSRSKASRRRSRGAAAYHEAGADVTFVEAPTSLEQIADIPRRLPCPQLVNIVLGGRTPEQPNERLRELGFAGVIYANVALQAAVKGMQAALGELQRKRTHGRCHRAWSSTSRSGSGSCGLDQFDALERKYAVK